MKYLKRINLKEININNKRKDIKETYQKGKKYYEETNKNNN